MPQLSGAILSGSGLRLMPFHASGAVVVADDESWKLPIWRCLPPLLRHPGLIRLVRHTDMHDPTRSQLDDEMQIQVPEEYVHDRQEVAGKVSAACVLTCVAQV